MEEVGIFYVHLVYFMAIWYSLCFLVSFIGFWYIYFHFGVLYQEKSGNPESLTVKKLASVVSQSET
jgi:hypothetical protein